MKTSKIVFSCVMFLLTLFLAACSGAENVQVNENESDKSYVMRVGHTLGTDSPRHQVLEEFKKRIEEKTEGHIKVELYPSNQLGDNNQLLQAVPLGTVEAAIQPTAFFGGVQNKIGVVDLPFIWKDLKHIEEVVSGETADAIMKPLEEKGIKGLALWPLGMQVMTSNLPLDNFDALKGQKFRTMGTPVQLELFKQWGTNPVAIALSELYSSLQNGVVDGQSNDIGTIHDLNLYEVQKYMLMTNHGPIIDVFYVNKEWFDKLPEEYQQALSDTAKELVSLKVEKELQVYDEKLKAIQESNKIQISTPDEAFLNELKKRAQVVIDQFVEQYPDMKEVVDKISQ